MIPVIAPGLVKVVVLLLGASIAMTPLNVSKPATKEEFTRINNKIEEAYKENDTRKLKIWRNKLNKWQLEYGAYGPIR